MKERLFYLVDANVAIPLRNPFKIQNKFVETINFVPETLPNQGGDSVLMNPNGIVTKGETWMPDLDFLMENDSIARVKSPFSPSEPFLRMIDDPDKADDDDDEWDEEDDDFDDDEDEDDEDWDEDDEEWDEDEDWDDEDEEEDDEDWEDEEEEA